MTESSKRKPTSFDVAELAGVSRSAVSRAFTPGAVVAEDTKERVFAAAEKLGYRVNSLARGLQGDHSGIVGILASRLDTPVRARQVKLLAQALIEDGFRPMIVTAENQEDVGGLIDSLIGYSVAGVIATSDSPPKKAIEQCQKLGVPVVLINRAGVLGWGDRVVSDPVESGEMAYEMLTSRGARNFAVLQPASRTFSVSGRAEAFAKVADGRCVVFQAEDQSYAGAHDAIVAAGRSAFEGIDGLFCATDLMALGAMDALRLDLGFAVPGDLQVVGFDDIEQASWGSYDLSTIRQNLEEQAIVALQLLKERMSDNSAETKTVTIDLMPVFRGSTKDAP